MPYRILILEGVRDEAAARRETHVQCDSSLQQHHFEHLYAGEYVALDETQPLRLVRLQQKALDENDLLQRVDQRLAALQADILLVHSCALFQSHLDELFFVAQTLKTSHPALRIGFRTRPFEQYGPRSFFEYTAEMRDLMSIVFADAKK